MRACQSRACLPAGSSARGVHLALDRLTPLPGPDMLHQFNCYVHCAHMHDVMSDGLTADRRSPRRRVDVLMCSLTGASPLLACISFHLQCQTLGSRYCHLQGHLLIASPVGHASVSRQTEKTEMSAGSNCSGPFERARLSSGAPRLPQYSKLHSVCGCCRSPPD